MIHELEVQSFLKQLKGNGNLQRLTTSLENNKSPVHRWFSFYAGFSRSLVSETIKFFGMNNAGSVVFDPFMGSGTTGVVGRELGVNVIGNEVNPFLLKICKAKMDSYNSVDSKELLLVAEELLEKASTKWKDADVSKEHQLLTRCYPVDNLKKLVTLRNLLAEMESTPIDQEKYFFVILTKCLLSSAQVGINVPYVNWSAVKSPKETFVEFRKNLMIVHDDLISASKIANDEATADVFSHDSRNENKEIKTGGVNMVFTSPPYLNNFDYAEALKVFLYFWGLARNWDEINERIRKVSVASATTYYKESSLLSKSCEAILGKEFVKKVPDASFEIIHKARLIRKRIAKRKTAAKSFDLLTLLYFKDMFYVLKELKRVLKEQSLCFMVVGDSAPYGVHVLTDSILGEMGLEMGFSSFTLSPLRKRGFKWRTLKYRHKQSLRESLLILRR
jgi:DNA modification methylase